MKTLQSYHEMHFAGGVSLWVGEDFVESKKRLMFGVVGERENRRGKEEEYLYPARTGWRFRNQHIN